MSMLLNVLFFLLLLQLFSSATGLAAAANNNNKQPSAAAAVKHIVMFSLKSDATAAQHVQIQQGLLSLPNKIPEIKSYQLGIDLLLEGGQNHAAGKNRGICWSASFDCQEDYETYEVSDAHKDFLAMLKPLVEPKSRSAIQFNPSL